MSKGLVSKDKSDFKSQVALILELIKKEEIESVSFRYSDVFGQLQNFLLPAKNLKVENLEEGIVFDGSSVRGFQSIEDSDLVLKPDIFSFYLDYTSNNPILAFTCSVYNTDDSSYYHDTRQIATRVEEYLISTGIADTAYFGPECEFFVFDKLEYYSSPNHSSYKITADNTPFSSIPHSSYTIPYKGGYFLTPPMDGHQDLRTEIVNSLEEAGIVVEKQHSEVATGGQNEINFRFDTLLKSADNTQKFKFFVRNVASNFGKIATFLPKPISGDNGSGMHANFSLFKNGKNLFVGKEYADLSQTALYAIGGIFKHAHSICSFTNPTINSYHRLQPGFEAPVKLAFGLKNRSTAVRIPFVKSDKEKRIECRFPDSSSNPYLAFSAITCAAIDGILNKIHPGKALEKDVFNLNKKEFNNIDSLPTSLTESLQALENDNKYLLDSGAFNKTFINTWLEYKNKEIEEIQGVPHPKEFQLYYDI